METQTVKDVIEKEQWYPHAIDKVWSAITDGKEMSKWIVPTNFKAEVGFQFELNSDSEDCNLVTGIVKEASPYTLIYTWNESHFPDIETTVRFDLSEKDNGTLVNLAHSGFSNYPADKAAQPFNNIDGGWSHCLSQLESLLK